MLFIDRLPMQEREITQVGIRLSTWQPLLPVIATEQENAVPARTAPCLPWKLDTAHELEASAWRFHLERVGLDPNRRKEPPEENAKIRSANDSVTELPIRKASLWLVSNIPSLRATPFPIYLFRGLPFFDTAPRRPERILPLVGIRALKRMRVQVNLNFQIENPTVSVWVPAPWYRACCSWVSRIPARFATIPPDELWENWVGLPQP
jgi:hypothetical protein